MKKLWLIVIMTFLIAVISGISFTMGAGNKGTMGNCPFMDNASSLCQMGVAEHMEKWRQLFAAIQNRNTFFLFVLGLLFTAFVIYRLTFYFSLAPPLVLIFQRYQKKNPEVKLFDHLLLAFSDGVIQPKIFA